MLHIIASSLMRRGTSYASTNTQMTGEPCIHVKMLLQFTRNSHITGSTMARTPSNMLPLGTKAPHFTLPDTVSENLLSFNDLKGSKGTLVMFICNHCPFVTHITQQLSKVCNQYQMLGIGIIAISSNDAENYPADSPDNMARFAKDNNFNFAYLYDESQAVAKAYDAACTPDFYLFNQESLCVYRGQFDDARPGLDTPVTGHDLTRAFDALLSNQPITDSQTPSLGCNIKWKP